MWKTSQLGPVLRRVISVRIQTPERTIETTGSRESVRDMPKFEKPAVVPAVLAVCAVALLIAVAVFDHDFAKQESHCNAQLCLDLVSISQVSMGILAIGNPISFGVVSVSSFVAVGVLPM